MYQVTNNSNTYEVASESNGTTLLNGNPLDWDIEQVRPGHYHVLHENRSYRVEVLDVNAEEKAVALKVNGKKYEFVLKDRFDTLLEKMGMSQMGVSKISEIKAPMPGLVLDILVEPGQEVAKGEPFIILEAMKMENVLKSPGDGVVKAIPVEKGAAVEKNEVILQFD